MTFSRRIEVRPLGEPPPDPALLAWLARGIEHTLRIPTRLGRRLRAAEGWLTDDGRYSSNALVEALIDRGSESDPSDGRWTLGVCVRDLAAPGRDFAFGEATFAGAWAVVSPARLAADGESAEAVMRQRLLKEALHELGHLAGLVHCSKPTCLMAPAEAPADVDGKETGFCGRCAASFRQKVGLDPTNF